MPVTEVSLKLLLLGPLVDKECVHYGYRILNGWDLDCPLFCNLSMGYMERKDFFLKKKDIILLPFHDLAAGHFLLDPLLLTARWR